MPRGPKKRAEPFFEGEVSNTSFMAEILGFQNDAPILSLAQRDVVLKAGYGAWFWRKSVPLYCQHLRDIVENSQGKHDRTAMHASISLKAAQERLTQIRADQISGKLIKLDEIETAWADIVVTIRQMVLSIPGRMRFGLPHMTAQDQRVLELICRDVLEEVASGKAPLPRED